MLDRTILEYDKRGPYGDPKFPGNNNGYIQKDLIETFEPESVLDPMAGSGTTRDVCKEELGRGMLCHSYDLSDGYNIEAWNTQTLIADNAPYDLIFWHPPYWAMIRYNFDTPRKKSDFSQGTYFQYLFRMRLAMTFLAEQLTPRGVLALQLGDYRTSGRTYFLMQDVMKSAEKSGLVEEVQCIISHRNEVQGWWTSSDGETDLPMRFGHEYLTILRRSDGVGIGTFNRTSWGRRDHAT